MAKVKRSTPFAAPAPLDPGVTATKAKKSASAGAAITPGKSPAAPSPLVVIEISSSPDRSTSTGGGRRSAKKARKMPAPRTLDLDDEIEMWTPRQKRCLDEDCQILAADPLSPTTEVAPSPAAANDEIAVVAERGKIACRDYPHPRSACAKHPFSSTPHERYCDKCFCFVCDVAAPCVSWKGNGGHCHASDRETKWKTMRFMKQKSKKAKPS